MMLKIQQMAGLILSVFLTFSLASSSATDDLLQAQYRQGNLTAALKYLDSVNSPANCTGLKYTIVEMGNAGGFSSQFQMAASRFMRVIASFKYEMPTLIVGSLRGYSTGPQCKHANNDWTCFFQPVSNCQEVLLKTGKYHKIKPTHHETISDLDSIPAQFKPLGLAFWWGVIQYKMFQMQPLTEKYVMEHLKNMNNGLGFPTGELLRGVNECFAFVVTATFSIVSIVLCMFRVYIQCLTQHEAPMTPVNHSFCLLLFLCYRHPDGWNAHPSRR